MPGNALNAYRNVHFSEIVYVLVSIFSVYIIQISNIFVLNIIMVMVLFLHLAKTNGAIRFIDKKLLFLLILFLIWVVLDTVLVSYVKSYSITARNIVQCLFNTQYVFMILDLRFDNRLYCKWYIRASVFYSIVVFCAFVYTGTVFHIDQLYGSYRDWTMSIFPGSSTSGPVPLLFGLFLAFYTNRSFGIRFIISLGCLLFPSRASLLGIFILWTYFYWDRMPRVLKVSSVLIAAALLLNVQTLLGILTEIAPSLAHRLQVTWDRQSIFSVFMDLAKNRPLTGYGGNTLEQLYVIENYTPDSPVLWQHTHNFVLEIILRYGLIGMLLFAVYYISYIKRIKERHCLFMTILLTGMGLFQIYLREFYFIFFFYILYSLSREECDKS